MFRDFRSLRFPILGTGHSNLETPHRENTKGENMAAYSIRKKTNLTYEEAVERAKEALKAEGFGVLTEINVKNTLKEKIGEDFRRYVILGSCNPQLAHRALLAELEIGLLLPCNVIVYEDDGGAVVAAQNPEAALNLVGNPALKPVAEEARRRLERVVEAV